MVAMNFGADLPAICPGWEFQTMNLVYRLPVILPYHLWPMPCL
jgi:hypothetical protein